MISVCISGPTDGELNLNIIVSIIVNYLNIMISVYI